MSPTQRTLKKLREEGYTAGIVEHWNPFAKIRQDLFGFVDIVAVGKGRGTLFVQCTSSANHSARVKKILKSPIAKDIIACYNTIEVWSWGKKKKKWEVRVERVGEIYKP